MTHFVQIFVIIAQVSCGELSFLTDAAKCQVQIVDDEFETQDLCQTYIDNFPAPKGDMDLWCKPKWRAKP